MSVSIFEPPPRFPNDEARELAVAASGALNAQGDPVLKAICSEVCPLVNAEAALISVLYGETQYVIAAEGFTPGAYRRRHSFSGHVIAAEEDIFFVPDLRADERFSENPWVNGEMGRFRLYMATLIRLDCQHPIGVVSALSSAPRAALSADEREVMLEAGELAAGRFRELRETADARSPQL